MEGVSQLYQKQAEIFSSRETNDRRRQEWAEMADRIGDLEKRLEEQVSSTNRHREKKVEATAILDKRLQTIQDLILKLDHVAKQNDIVHSPRLALAAKGVLGHEEGVAAEVLLDLGAAAERLVRAVSRRDESRKQRELTKNFPAANLAKDKESRELASRAEELEAGTEALKEEQNTAETSRISSAKVVEQMQNEKLELTRRIEVARSRHQQISLEMKKLKAEIEEAERSENEQSLHEDSQKERVLTDVQALEFRLSELSVENKRQSIVDGEKAELEQKRQALASEKEKVNAASKQEDSKVIAMQAQLQRKIQRKEMLTDQKATAEENFATHAINEPEFGDRKAEHQLLTSKIATIRSIQASTGARKATHEEEARRVAQETTATTTAIGEDISAERKVQLLVSAEREQIALAVKTKEAAVAKEGAKRDTIEAKREEVSTSLELLCALEEKQKLLISKEDPEHDSAIVEAQVATRSLIAEDEQTRRILEDLERELKKKEEIETERRKIRTEADKHRLFSESVARRTQEEYNTIEAARNEELNLYQGKIITEDEKFRAAWLDASQNPAGGGVEERLQEELAAIEAQKAAEYADVEATESRIQRLREMALQ